MKIEFNPITLCVCRFSFCNSGNSLAIIFYDPHIFLRHKNSNEMNTEKLEIKKIEKKTGAQSTLR